MEQQIDTFEFKEENHFLGFSNPSSNIKLDIGGHKQQTAVSWLISQIGQYLEMNIKEAINIIEQAKQMEKEQIMNAWIEEQAEESDRMLAEQYYNETYNK